MKPVALNRTYQVHHYEVDTQKRAFITSIMNYLSDAAIHQGELLNIGIDYLKEREMAWVLYKWDITIERYPTLEEEIQVITVPYAFRKFYAYRKYEIRNEENKIIGYANSIWLLINVKRKRPIKITEELHTAFGLVKEEGQIVEIENIEEIENIQIEKRFDVRYSDIDTNNHVNNVKYVAWVLETIPKEMVSQYQLQNIKVVYEKETKYGEEITVQTEIKEMNGEMLGIHRILDQDKKELTKVRSLWRRGDQLS